ncbi:MAG: tetratricopeptide repeat protein [Acidobacteriota bacterium]|nr:tetratricopeptide repeat protein [Acidobacteriota bacterium]
MITLALSTSACVAQANPAQTSPASPCQTSGKAADQTASKIANPCQAPASDTKKPSATEQFPFPGEPAKSQSRQSQTQPDGSPGAGAPDSPSPSTSPSSAAAQHPFPSQPPPRLPGDDSSSSSSSGANPDDATPDAPTTQDTPTPVPGEEGSSVHSRRRLPKVQHVQSDDERVDEDLRVAKFYMRDENLPGAYLRAKDAVHVQPDYSDTHFTLAEVAEKMKKKEEAVAEYKAYLKLDPSGDKAKAAQRALEDLQ